MTNAELTILSLVAEGPRYGYEIQSIIDERELRDWLAIGSSSIYYVLNKLESQHMLTSELHESESGPARKVYRVTEAGRGVLQTAIADLLSQSPVIGSGFELGLANLSALGPTQVYRALMKRETDLEQRLESAQQTWKRHQHVEDTALDDTRALYTHALTVMQAELDWLRDFLKDWRERYPAATAKDVPDDSTRPGMDPHQLQRLRRPPMEE
jgi:DNA-binding PadR family transcriptional regulator